VLEQITSHLANLEEQAGNLARAISYLQMVKKVSPNPAGIQWQIDQLTPKLGAAPAGTNAPSRSP
jgi:hypothetical protein